MEVKPQYLRKARSIVAAPCLGKYGGKRMSGAYPDGFSRLLAIYKSHLVPYESIMQSLMEVRERMEEAESAVIAAFDATSMDSLIDNGESITVVTGADGKRFLVIVEQSDEN